jgi:hypothetical protein
MALALHSLAVFCSLKAGVEQVKRLIETCPPGEFLEGTLDGQALDELVQAFEDMEGAWGSTLARNFFTNSIGLDLTIKRLLEACTSIPRQLARDYSTDIDRHADLEQAVGNLMVYEGHLSVFIDRLQRAVGELVGVVAGCS